MYKILKCKSKLRFSNSRDPFVKIWRHQSQRVTINFPATGFFCQEYGQCSCFVKFRAVTVAVTRIFEFIF